MAKTGNIGIGKPLDRADGRLKVTGKAIYTADTPVSNIAYGAFSLGTIASGKILKIDTTDAEKVSGVIKIFTHLNTPKFQKLAHPPAGQTFLPLQTDEIKYAGQAIALVIAETSETARFAADLITAEYQKEEFEADFIAAKSKSYSAENFAKPNTKVGDFKFTAPGKSKTDAETKNEKQLRLVYQTPNRHHNPIESSATIAAWQNDNLLLYNTTQGVVNCRQTIAGALGIAPEKIRVVTKFVGGAYGCKGYVWAHEFLSAVAAREIKRPVKIVLTREDDFTFHGYQAASEQILTIAAEKDGKIKALKHDSLTPTSTFDDYVEYAAIGTRVMYAAPALETTHRVVKVNFNNPTPMRAPHEGLSMFGLESAMDELAYELKVDPVELRLKNYAERDPTSGKPFSSKKLRECYTEGAKIFGWDKRKSEPRSIIDGNHFVGMGLASATMTTFRFPNKARISLKYDGSIRVETASQEIGTGVDTILAQIASEVLQIPAEKIDVVIGDTSLPEAAMTAGSSTTMCNGSAVYDAAAKLKKRIEEISGAKYSPETLGSILKDKNLEILSADGEWTPGNKNMFGEPDDVSMHTFGAIFAEVRVDRDLMIPHVSRIVGVYSVGRIINPKTAKSQMTGGMIWGIGQALTEHSVVEKNFGCFLNRDLASYEIPVNSDVPKLEAHFVAEVDERASAFGGKGIGELGAVGVSAAIANAIFNATGNRVRELPVTIDKLL